MPDSNNSSTRVAVSRAAKAEGAFLALAAGDALGWPQEMPRNLQRSPANQSARLEFTKWTRRGGGRFQPYEEEIQPGDYSDDTQLTLAVARARISHGSDWWKALTHAELPFWLLYERGGGGATKRAAHAWTSGMPPWKSKKKGAVRRYFDAGGNGVAMRVLPHALFFGGFEEPAALMHDVVLDGSATHGHPRALVGAAAYAYAAWWLARRTSTLGFGELLDTLIHEEPVWGKPPKPNGRRSSWFEVADNVTAGYELIWNRTVGEMRELLQEARKGVQAGALADDHAVLKVLGCFGPSKGAGTISAAAAAYLAARHAAQPVQGLLRAAYEKGADTDTLAAMTGGLLGCLAGVEWLPSPWLNVQDADYLRSIARRVALGPEEATQKPVEPPPSRRSVLADLEYKGEISVALGEFKQVQTKELPSPKPLSSSISVRAWRLQTAEGQSIFVTKARKLTAKTRITRATGKRRKATPHLSPDAQSAISRVSDNAVVPGADSPNPLYAEFCRQLQDKFAVGEVRRTDLTKSLDLVPSQIKKWLEQAESEGWLRRTSKNPAKYAVIKRQQSLL